MPIDCPRPMPHSHTGRVMLAIASSLLAALLIVAWSPALAGDTEAPAAESPYFHVNSDDPGDRPPAAQGHPRRRARSPA